MPFETSFTVEWGDCDEAGIVFYPTYFYWLDCTFQRLLRSKGLSQRTLRTQFRAVVPLMDVGCNFRGSVTYDDELVIKATIVEWGEKRFRIDYAFFLAGRQVATGHELRAWAVKAPDGRLKGAPVDPVFKALMSG